MPDGYACITEARLVAELERHGSVRALAATTARFSVEVEARAGGWVARIARSTDEAEGVREVDLAGAPCGEVLQSLGLILALMLEAEEADRSETPTLLEPPLDSRADEPTTPETAEATPETTVATSAQARARRAEAFLVAQAELAWGRLPAWRPGASVRADVAVLPWLELRLGIRHFFAGEFDARPEGTTIRAHRTEALVGACGRTTGPRAQGAICAGVSVGSLRATGGGYTENASDRQLALTADVALELRLPLSRRFAFVTGIAGGYAPIVNRFTYRLVPGDGVSDAYVGTRFSAGASAGLAVRLF